MKITKCFSISIFFSAVILLLQGCTLMSPAVGWDEVKNKQSPNNALPAEYQTPFRQPISTLAWEDGVYITRDGLTLYAQYTRLDLYKATVVDQKKNPDLYPYQRGPDLGQDLSAPSGSGITTPWIHSDLVFASRAGTSDAFSSWTLSGVKKKLFNDAAPQGILNAADASKFDAFVYTDDDTNPSYYSPKIRILRNVPRNPQATGDLLLSSSISPDSYYDENPHVERWDSGDSKKWVLIFDSKSRSSSLDLFYTTSTDNGTNWSAVQAITSVNTGELEHQPHLYHDGSVWWLYFSSINSGDGKPAIHRCRQSTAGNWNSWGSKELVVSAGSSVGVGEPSLTSSGDLSFVVITENNVGPTATDKYDSDPWFMKKK